MDAGDRFMTFFETIEEAEMATVGAALLSDSVVQRLARTLRPEHFSLSWLATTWTAILELVRTGTAVDLVTVRDALGPQRLESIGGVPFLVRLVDDVPSAANGEFYAKIVMADYARRELRSRAEAVVGAADSSCDLDSLLVSAGKIADGLRFGIRPVVNACDVLGELKAKPGVNRLCTGVDFFDRACGGGLYCGEMNILGGDTGAGKTLLGTQIAAHDIRQGRRGIFVSLEMTGAQLVSRLVKQMTGHMNEGEAREAGDLASWEEGTGEIYRSDFQIYDSSLSSNPTVEEILGVLYDQHEQSPLQWATVDYAQKLRLADPGRRENHDVHREISEKFRVFAKKTGVRLVVLSQINNEQGGGFTVRGSKEYQMDAAFIAGVMNTKRGEDDRDVVIQKNRHGKKATWEARINQVTLCLEDSLGGFNG